MLIFWPIWLSIKKNNKLNKIIPAPIKSNKIDGFVIRNPTKATNSKMYSKKAKTFRWKCDERNAPNGENKTTIGTKNCVNIFI